MGVYSVNDLYETEITFDVKNLFSNIVLNENNMLVTILDLYEKSGPCPDNAHPLLVTRCFSFCVGKLVFKQISLYRINLCLKYVILI